MGIDRLPHLSDSGVHANLDEDKDDQSPVSEMSYLCTRGSVTGCFHLPT